MVVWVGGRVDERVDGLLDGRGLNGQKDGWVDGRMFEWVSGWVDICLDGWVCWWLDVSMGG